MTIKVGDKIPSVNLLTMTADGRQTISTDELFKGKKVVLFAVPGAFTPTCSEQHLPGFIMYADEIKARGVNTIACIAVNDVFVMDAWGKNQNVGDKVLMLADSDGEFTKAIDLELDLRGKGLGVRSQRYAMIVEDGILKSLQIDPPKTFKLSKAESILERL